MKYVLYVLAALTGLYALGAWATVGDSAGRQNVAVMSWTATLIALGSAAIVSAVDAAKAKASKDSEELRHALGEIRKYAETTAKQTSISPPPVPGFNADAGLDAMLASRGLLKSPTPPS